VLVLRLDAEEAHAHPVHRPALAQEVPPAQRQQAPAHLLRTWLMSGVVIARPTASPVDVTSATMNQSRA
jgi:hypothetical protein